ncbi:MAG: transcriptional regulator ArsR family [Herbinix sp.]|jgi:ArsR family transcriptional regulator|nr:transcriptional regulator ArsR family [Herbinix sp.]
MDEKYVKYALIFKALSDANRLLIIDSLMSGECCACRILDQLQITQPTLSHHMKILSDNNIVNVRKDGKWMYYSLNCAKFAEIKEVLELFSKQSSVKMKEYPC